MSTLVMSDATTKTIQVIGVTGLTTQCVDIGSTQANRLECVGKHTLASSDPYSRDRHLFSVLRKKVDTTTNRQIEVGCNMTVWSSNHPNILLADKYDVIWAMVCAVNGTATAMDAPTKSRIDKLFAGANLFN
jgi:hypothetical protein